MTAILTVNNTYNISTRAPAILGASYEKVKLVSILDYDTAVSLDSVDTIHRSILSLLPSGTSEDPSTLTYYRFKLQDGSKKIFALPWLLADDIQVINIVKGVFTVIANNDTALLNVRDAILALGIDSFTMEVQT